MENYTWDPKNEKIKIDFTFNKDSFTGPTKSIPQKGWIHNKQSNAHWMVSPLWPLRFDYLIIDLADDYSWTAIGVPNQKYLWIMSREWNFDDSKVQEISTRLKEKGYDVQNILRPPLNAKDITKCKSF